MKWDAGAKIEHMVLVNRLNA